MKIINKNKVSLGILLFVVIFVGMGMVSAEVNSYAPVKQNECVTIKQVCSSCTYVNVSVSYPNSSLAVTNQEMTAQGGGVWTYEFCNTSSLGRYDINGEGDLEGTPTGFDVLWFDVTEFGQQSDSKQGYLIIGLLGVIALCLTIAFSFDKTKWKLRSLFIMTSILLGVVTLNSIRILAGSSELLSKMGLVGIIVGLAVTAFMFLFVMINYTIEVFGYFKKKRKMKWEVNEAS